MYVVFCVGKHDDGSVHVCMCVGGQEVSVSRNICVASCLQTGYASFSEMTQVYVLCVFSTRLPSLYTNLCFIQIMHIFCRCVSLMRFLGFND